MHRTIDHYIKRSLKFKQFSLSLDFNNFNFLNQLFLELKRLFFNLVSSCAFPSRFRAFRFISVFDQRDFKADKLQESGGERFRAVVHDRVSQNVMDCTCHLLNLDLPFVQFEHFNGVDGRSKALS